MQEEEEEGEEEEERPSIHLWISSVSLDCVLHARPRLSSRRKWMQRVQLHLRGDARHPYGTIYDVNANYLLYLLLSKLSEINKTK